MRKITSRAALITLVQRLGLQPDSETGVLRNVKGDDTVSLHIRAQKPASLGLTPNDIILTIDTRNTPNTWSTIGYVTVADVLQWSAVLDADDRMLRARALDSELRLEQIAKMAASAIESTPTDVPAPEWAKRVLEVVTVPSVRVQRHRMVYTEDEARVLIFDELNAAARMLRRDSDDPQLGQIHALVVERIAFAVKDGKFSTLDDFGYPQK